MRTEGEVSFDERFVIQRVIAKLVVTARIKPQEDQYKLLNRVELLSSTERDDEIMRLVEYAAAIQKQEDPYEQIDIEVCYNIAFEVFRAWIQIKSTLKC
ncbi:hypothetical protein ACFLZH_05900 [Patescibacteria group bacterium]